MTELDFSDLKTWIEILGAASIIPATVAAIAAVRSSRLALKALERKPPVFAWIAFIPEKDATAIGIRLEVRNTAESPLTLQSITVRNRGLMLQNQTPHQKGKEGKTLPLNVRLSAAGFGPKDRVIASFTPREAEALTFWLSPIKPGKQFPRSIRLKCTYAWDDQPNSLISLSITMKHPRLRNAATS